MRQDKKIAAGVVIDTRKNVKKDDPNVIQNDPKKCQLFNFAII